MSEALNRLGQSQAAKAKTLAEWRADRLKTIDDMPSGMPGVVIRDLSMQDIVMMDSVEIPNMLLDMMLDNDARQLKKAEDAIPDGELILLMMKNKKEFNLMLDEIARAALVKPAIGDQTDDDHITVDELIFRDKLHIFEILNQETLAVRPFPDKDETGATAPSGGSVPSQAE